MYCLRQGTGFTEGGKSNSPYYVFIDMNNPAKWNIKQNNKIKWKG